MFMWKIVNYSFSHFPYTVKINVLYCNAVITHRINTLLVYFMDAGAKAKYRKNCLRKHCWPREHIWRHIDNKHKSHFVEIQKCTYKSKLSCMMWESYYYYLFDIILCVRWWWWWRMVDEINSSHLWNVLLTDIIYCEYKVSSSFSLCVYTFAWHELLYLYITLCNYLICGFLSVFVWVFCLHTNCYMDDMCTHIA